MLGEVLKAVFPYLEHAADAEITLYKSHSSL